MATSSGTAECLPFLKWAGGKRWLVRRSFDVIPRDFSCYFEPFLGSGALFFALQPSRAILSDLNAELVGTYRAIKDDWKSVASLLAKHHKQHSENQYYSVRSSRPRSQAAKAARFIYLNRTCWNGLYRVNKRGQFNVPVGSKQNVVLPTDDFQRVSKLLQQSSLIASDFEGVVDRAGRHDLIFADPPYVTAHSHNGFLKYNEKLFCWDDQQRLVDCLTRAKERGSRIVVTNADTPAIRRLYKKSFTIRSITRASIIAGDSANRGTTSELVMTSW